MAKADGAKPDGSKASGAMGTIVALLLLTIIGGGGGGYLGYSLAPPPIGNSAGATAAPPTTADGAGAGGEDASKSEKHGADHADAHGKGGHDKHDGEHADSKAAGGALQVKELPTIVTNLAQSETSWIRLQAAIVYDPAEVPHSEKLIAEIMSDITAFLRNVTVASLEGSDGLRRLQEDLSERAAIRSDRKVRELIIETMVVQ